MTDDYKERTDALWAQIRDALTKLDEIVDEGEDVPDGQVIANYAIAYSTQFIENDELQFITTYMVPPGIATESAVGLFRLAESQIRRDVQSDDD